MQNYKEINGNDYVKDSRITINETMRSIQSMNSGTVFPTTNLFEGMKCYRTDLKKTYTLVDLTTGKWAEDAHAETANEANHAKTSDDANSAESAKKDSDGNIISETYATKEELSAKADSSSLKAVATSGSYNDLADKPTKVSSFANDAHYLTEHQDLSGYQKKLTFDSSPADGSSNPVTSDGIKKAIAAAQDGYTVVGGDVKPTDKSHWIGPSNGAIVGFSARKIVVSNTEPSDGSIWIKRVQI